MVELKKKIVQQLFPFGIFLFFIIFSYTLTKNNAVKFRQTVTPTVAKVLQLLAMALQWTNETTDAGHSGSGSFGL